MSLFGEGVGAVSFGKRLTDLAAQHPERTAILVIGEQGDETQITWLELEQRANQVARRFGEAGVCRRAIVAVALPNSIEHFVATFAAWKVGATVLPLRWALPDRERDVVLETARPALVVTEWSGIAFPTLSSVELADASAYSCEPLPDVVPQPGFAIGSGGSTGRPKIIVNPAPMARVPDDPSLGTYQLGMRSGQIQLVPGPLYHTLGFSWGHFGLFENQRIVVLQRWDAARVIDLVERERVNFMALVPAMMQRIAAVPGWCDRDWSSIEALYHSGGMCPPWLKRAWIDLLGPDRVYEAFGSTESIGQTYIRGGEWLTRPGSVGRPKGTDLRIRDAAGNDLPCGEVGDIYLRAQDGSEPCHYLGAPQMPVSEDGFRTVGDLGWVDADGYLYPVDRRIDMIISGGANIYPAEVEAALSDHPLVADVVVVGVPDVDWGRRVHAIIQLVPGAQRPEPSILDAWARERIAAYKVPKSYEFLDALPREDSGKIRRSALAEERSEGLTPAMMPVS